jgi:phosphohistidine phosphatase
MDVLILMRHGKAVREAPSDRERGLAPRGVREAAAAGAQIVAAGLTPDRVLVSAAERTRQTYAALAGDVTAPAEFLEPLYMANAKTIWDAAAASGGRVVLVIGHNPGMHELAIDLVAQSHEKSAATKTIRERFPTSAFAAFSITGDVRHAAGSRLVAHWSPKD